MLPPELTLTGNVPSVLSLIVRHVGKPTAESNKSGKSLSGQTRTARKPPLQVKQEIRRRPPYTHPVSIVMRTNSATLDARIFFIRFDR